MPNWRNEKIRVLDKCTTKISWNAQAISNRTERMNVLYYSFCLMVFAAVFLLFFFCFTERAKTLDSTYEFPSHEITYTEREYNNNNACGVDFGRILYTISVNREFLRESNFHRPLHLDCSLLRHIFGIHWILHIKIFFKMIFSQLIYTCTMHNVRMEVWRAWWT